MTTIVLGSVAAAFSSCTSFAGVRGCARRRQNF